MEITVNNNGEKIKLNAKKLGRFSRGIGLMFRSKNTNNLLFDFDRDVTMSITSFFVFFDFLALWLDADNNIVDKKIISPFTLSIRPNTKFRKLVEIPYSKDNYRIIKFFLGKGERFK